MQTIIRGGEVVDGTGAPRVRADVGIDAGRIVAVGDVPDADGAEVIDASGLVVAPGFIDVHTHFDAQVFWDPSLRPSCEHGITTVFAGNCGFTISPLTPDAASYLLPMLARVEGMPKTALETGVPWDWASTAEYLDRIDGTTSLNIGISVGHSALRRVVMGDAATERHATAAEIEAMEGLLRAGLAAGAIGFSTSRAAPHTDGDGQPVPSRHAAPEELVALAAVCGDFPGTSLEMVPSGWRFSDEEAYLLMNMTLAAKRPINWNLMTTDATTEERDIERLDLGHEAHERGGKIVGLSQPITFPNRLCFLTPFSLDGLPGWGEPMSLPPAERLALLRDPEQRRRLEQMASATRTQLPLIDWGAKVIAETFSPETKRFEGAIVADIAAGRGVSNFDALLDIVCADELRTTFTRIPPVYSDEDWAARRRVWRHPYSLIGASDAGAHLDFLASFNYTTYLLEVAVREVGVLELEEAVHMLTQAPAELYGAVDRGVLRRGAHADVVVFDPDTIASETIRTVHDLPGGAWRLHAGAVGIEHVLVNGVAVTRSGAVLDARPGTLLRSGRDTVTPSLDQ